MGLFDIFTSELPSSKDEPEMEKWKETAKNILKHYYLSFRGSQWDCYTRGTKDEALLLSKICFAMYGPPTSTEEAIAVEVQFEDEDLSKDHAKEQVENGKKIQEKILQVVSPPTSTGQATAAEDQFEEEDLTKGHAQEQVENANKSESFYSFFKKILQVFTPPTSTEQATAVEDQFDDEDLTKGYAREQVENGKKILEKILQVRGPESDLLVGIIFVLCKQEEAEFILPIFSVFTGVGSPELASEDRMYVDSQCRLYNGWTDWEKNNTLPMMNYAYPRHGFFSCSDEIEYVFDPEKDPSIKFATSPQSNLTSRIFHGADTLTAFTSLACGGVSLASLFLPIGPGVLLASTICGGSSAFYGTGRAINRIVDKGQHGESLADLESSTLWFSIAATPLHFATSFLNANLVRGASANGRILSSSTRFIATVLNFGTLGVDGVLVGFGLWNLLEKMEQKQLTALDCLQFSLSVFFFTNTLIEPKMASKIIERAQDQHMLQYKDNIKDESAKINFQKLMDDNMGKGTITDKSNIIRTINRIENPEAFFGGGGLKDATNLKIGGRKGKTIIVTDANQQTNRINPNRVLFTEDVTEFLGKDPNYVEVNGNKIFQNLTKRQKARVANVIPRSSSQIKAEVVNLAKEITDKMKMYTVDAFLSIVEILGAEVNNRDKGVTQTDAINAIRENMPGFIDGINKDVRVAEQLANQSNLKFEDPLKAVYHFRKHGADFPSRMESQNPIKVYLNQVPEKLITDANLVEIKTFQDGTKRKIYLDPNDNFAVVIESNNSRKIATMFRKPGAMNQTSQRLADIHASGNLVEILKGVEDIARVHGFHGAPVFVSSEGQRVKFNDLELGDDLHHVDLNENSNNI